MFVDMDSEFLNSSNKLDRSTSLTDLTKLYIDSPSNYNVFESPGRRFKDIQKQFGNKPLVRHFSCEQIYDPRISSSPLIKIKDTVSVGFRQHEVAWPSGQKQNNGFKNHLMLQENMTDSPNSSGDPSDIKYFGNLRNFDFSFVKDCVEKLDVTPMDIDKSAEEPKDDVECDSKIRKRRRIKKEDDVQENRRKILKSESEQSSSKTVSKARLFFFIFVVPLCSYLTLFHHRELTINENIKVFSQKIFGQRDKCDEILNINPMLNNVKEHLYGQDSVIKDLSRNFHINIFKTLIFAGPTGVGKTHTVKRIEETFTWSKNIHTVAYPVTESSILVLKLTLSHCGYNLIIMDGLTNTTSEHIYDFVRSIQQHTYEKKMKTFVILVYNTQEISDDLKSLPYDSSEDILKGFKSEFKESLDVNLIPFNKLSIDDVVRCTLSEAAILGMKVSQKQALEIAKDIPEIYGCKGVRARLNIQNPVKN